MKLSHLPHCIEGFEPYTIKGHTIQGHSVCRDRTGIYSFQLQAHFDSGMGCSIPMKNLFQTHLHSDHMQGLPMLLYGNPTPPTIFCLEETVDDMKAMIAGFGRAARSHKKFTIVGVQPGDRYMLDEKREVVIHHCQHSVPTCGYGFRKKTSRLKPEIQAQLQLLSGKDKGAFLKGKEDIHEITWTPEFLYLCDTDISVFETDASILTYSVIMVECSFWDSKMEERALETGHICFPQLLPYIRATPKTHFILFHVSQRYTWETLQKIIDQAEVANVTLFRDQLYSAKRGR